MLAYSATEVGNYAPNRISARRPSQEESQALSSEN